MGQMRSGHHRRSGARSLSKKAVKSHEAEEDYGADKGVGFKFEHAHQAHSFIRDVNANHRDLVADQH